MQEEKIALKKDCFIKTMSSKKFEKIYTQANAEKEKSPRLKYEDLIELYYFEALRQKRPTVERAFERIVNEVRNEMIDHAKDYLKNWGNNEPISTAEGALNSYFEDFLQDISNENDPDKLFTCINVFIMYIHERLRLSLGEELLGMSSSDLEALNYIDIDKPLNEQEKIIWDKLQEYEDKK